MCSSKILFEKYDDVRIELIEEYPCENKMVLERREGEHIRNNNCINKMVSGRTQKEWREDNKDKLQEICKEYYENNKEEILAKMREIITCECGCEITKNHISRHKASKKHIEFIKEKIVS